MGNRQALSSDGDVFDRGLCGAAAFLPVSLMLAAAMEGHGQQYQLRKRQGV